MPSRTPRELALEERRAEFLRLKRWRRDRHEAIERAIVEYVSSPMATSEVNAITQSVQRVIQFHMLRRLASGFSGAVQSYIEYAKAKVASGERMASLPLPPALLEQMTHDSEWFDYIAYLLNYRLFKYQTNTLIHNLTIDCGDARKRLLAYAKSEPEFSERVRGELLYDKKCLLLLGPEESDQVALERADAQEKRFVCDATQVADLTHALDGSCHLIR